MGFMQRRGAQWFVTLVLAALLVGLGHELARHELLPDLQGAQNQAASEASRANRLFSENQRLEQRLAEAEARLASRGESPAAPPEAPGAVSRVLHRDEAALMLGGRLVLILEDISADRGQAAIKARVLGGQEGGVRLKAGGDVKLRLDGRVYHLVLKKILTNSVIVTVLPE
ncbi:MAG: hypothetical protein ACOZHQ_08495 [Thermodesulfobacteriota bacterium]